MSLRPSAFTVFAQVPARHIGSANPMYNFMAKEPIIKLFTLTDMDGKKHNSILIELEDGGNQIAISNKLAKKIEKAIDKTISGDYSFSKGTLA